MLEIIRGTAPLLKAAFLAAAMVGLVLVSIGCVTRAEGEKSAMETPNVVGNAEIPPIDAVAPEVVETATFALG